MMVQRRHSLSNDMEALWRYRWLEEVAQMDQQDGFWGTWVGVYVQRTWRQYGGIGGYLGGRIGRSSRNIGQWHFLPITRRCSSCSSILAKTSLHKTCYGDMVALCAYVVGWGYLRRTSAEEKSSLQPIDMEAPKRCSEWWNQTVTQPSGQQIVKLLGPSSFCLQP